MRVTRRLILGMVAVAASSLHATAQISRRTASPSGAIRSRRRHRSDRARGGRSWSSVRQSGSRTAPVPAHDCCRRHRQGRARRLYADAGNQRYHVDESHHLKHLPYEPGKRLAARCADRRVPFVLVVNPSRPCTHCGSCEGRQRAAAQLRVRRRRRIPSSQCRALSSAWHQDDARAV